MAVRKSDLPAPVRKVVGRDLIDVHKRRTKANRRAVGRRIAFIRSLRQPRPAVRARGRATFDHIIEGPAKRWAHRTLKPIHDAFSPTELALLARHEWDRVAKAGTPQDEVAARVAAAIRAKTEAMPTGAMAGYLGLADAATTESGQMTLDSLGINKTWRWTGVRDVTPDLYQARGSKVIQGMYGEHVDRLANIAARAANPANPMTMAEVSSEIDENWAGMERYQVDRIARTESAVMWETTAANTYALNGIGFVEWLDFNAEDELCLDNVADGAIPMGSSFSSGDTEPPAHPNCVCDLLPVLENPETGEHWLPPAEPFTGNMDTLPLVRIPAPSGAIEEFPTPLPSAPLPGLSSPAGAADAEGVDAAEGLARDRLAARNLKLDIETTTDFDEGLVKYHRIAVRDVDGKSVGDLFVREQAGRFDVTSIGAREPGVANELASAFHDTWPDATLRHGVATAMDTETEAWARALPSEWNAIAEPIPDVVDDGVLELTQVNAREWAENAGYPEWAKGLPADERQAVTSYTDWPNNKFLRAGGAENPDILANPNPGQLKQLERIRAMDAAMEKAPALEQDLRVFRLVDKQFVAGEPGDVLLDKGYVSTTVSREWAESNAGFAGTIDGQTIMDIRVPAGTRGAYVGYGSDGIGSFPGQWEYILPRNGSFRVVEVLPDRIVVEFIPPEVVPVETPAGFAEMTNSTFEDLARRIMRADTYPDVPVRTDMSFEEYQQAVENGDGYIGQARREYLTSNYKGINTYLRTGVKPWTRIEQTVDYLDQAMTKAALDQDTILYRGMPKSMFDGVKAGDRYVDSGFISTTTERSTADTFGSELIRGTDRVTVRIEAPEGTNFMLGNTAENELVLPRGSQFEVITNDGDNVVLRLTTPDEPPPMDFATAAKEGKVTEGELVGQGINKPRWGEVDVHGESVPVVIKNPGWGGANAIHNEQAAKLVADRITGIDVPDVATYEHLIDPYNNVSETRMVSRVVLNPDGSIAPNYNDWEMRALKAIRDAQTPAAEDAAQAVYDKGVESIMAQRKRMDLLDYIIGNSDRHELNYLVQDTADGVKVWPIDHEAWDGYFSAVRESYELSDEDIAGLRSLYHDQELADLVPDRIDVVRQRIDSLLDKAGVPNESGIAPVEPVAPPRVFEVPEGPLDPQAAIPLKDAPLSIDDRVGLGINDARWGKMDLGEGNKVDVIVKGADNMDVQAAEVFAQDLNEVGEFGVNIPAIAARDLRAEGVQLPGSVMNVDYYENAVVQMRVPDVVNGGAYQDMPMAYEGAEGPAFGVDRVPLDIQAKVMEQRRRMDLFDRVIGNADRNRGNWLVNPDTGDVYAIDHGLALDTYSDPAMVGMKNLILPNGDDIMADKLLTNEEHDILVRVKEDLENPDGTLRQLMFDDRDAEPMLKRVNAMLEHGTIDGTEPPPPPPEPEPIIDPSLDPALDERMMSGNMRVGAKVGVDSVNDVKFARIGGKDGFRVVVKTRGGYGDTYFGAEKEAGAQVINDALGDAGANLPRVVIRNAGSGNEQIIVARIDNAITYNGVQRKLAQPLLARIGGGFTGEYAVPESDLRGMTLLDNIIGNTDRHMGNVMFTYNEETGEYRLFAIDHGLTFPAKPGVAPGTILERTEVSKALQRRVASAAGEGNANWVDVPLTSQERESLRIMLDNWDATAAKLRQAGLQDDVAGHYGDVGHPIEEARARIQAMYDKGLLIDGHA